MLRLLLGFILVIIVFASRQSPAARHCRGGCGTASDAAKRDAPRARSGLRNLCRALPRTDIRHPAPTKRFFCSERCRETWNRR